MAGLGLMNRRRAIASSPTRVSPLEVILENCVGWYTFEGRSNSDSDRDIVYDRSGKGNDMTLYNMNYGWEDPSYDVKEGFFNDCLYMKTNGSSYGQIILSQPLSDVTILCERTKYGGAVLKDWAGLVGSGKTSAISPIHVEYKNGSIISKVFGSEYIGAADTGLIWCNRDYYCNVPLQRVEPSVTSDNYLYINKFRGDVAGGGALKMKRLYIFNRSLTYQEIELFIHSFIDPEYVMPTLK